MGNSSSRYARDPATFASAFSPQPSSIISEEYRQKLKSFDYVIVGGGTAGCVLASRLSEDPNTTVLLLEAGGSHESNLFSRIPLAFFRLLKSPADWNFETAPQKGLDGRTVHFPRGRILGGTSSINALVYHRSDPEDFDSWEKKGATGWGYSTLKKYFERVEKDGPRIDPKTELAPVSAAALEAMQNIGIPLREDFNTDEGTCGAGRFAAAIDANHERSSAATAYLTPEVLSRPNLTVAISVYTERVLFTTGPDGTPTAVGVQLSAGRIAPKFAVAAAREVILSAGVIGSPQLLLVSGVGPAAQLKQHRIPLLRDLPHVGQNFTDHLSAGSLVLRARAGQTLDQYTQNPLYGAFALLQWLLTGTGPMSALSAQVVAFTRFDQNLPYGPDHGPIKDMSSGPTAPDLEIVVFPVAVIKHGLAVPPLGNYGISVGSVVLKPASTGSVEIRSNSIYDPPIIDPNYLGDESDKHALIKSVRFILRLARTAPLSDSLDLRTLSAPPPNPDFYWPGDADPDALSDEEIIKFIRKNAQSPWHPLSTARMGTDAGNSVVDLDLRVHGIKGLRVVDGSVFPDQVSGHPCVPILAVAERAADIIKGVA